MEAGPGGGGRPETLERLAKASEILGNYLTSSSDLSPELVDAG